LLDRVAMPDPAAFRPPNVERAFAWTRWHDNWIRRPDLWLGPDALDAVDWSTLDAMLRDYLTDERCMFDGAAYQWLAACAVYPAVRWDLTVFLGVRLRWVDAPGAHQPIYTEARCARLTHLPWFKVGYMPAWLRRRLIATLSRTQRTAVARHLTDVLEHAVLGGAAGVDAMRLKIHQDNPDLPAGEPLRDEVFLEFLASRDELWLAAPRKLAATFNNLRTHRILEEWAVLGLLAVYFVAAVALVPWPGDGALDTGSWVPVGMLALSLLTWPVARWLLMNVWWSSPS
jgi:hypothetical protein